MIDSKEPTPRKTISILGRGIRIFLALMVLIFIAMITPALIDFVRPVKAPENSIDFLAALKAFDENSKKNPDTKFANTEHLHHDFPTKASTQTINNHLTSRITTSTASQLSLKNDLSQFNKIAAAARPIPNLRGLRPDLRPTAEEWNRASDALSSQALRAIAKSTSYEDIKKQLQDIHKRYGDDLQKYWDILPPRKDEDARNFLPLLYRAELQMNLKYGKWMDAGINCWGLHQKDQAIYCWRKCGLNGYSIIFNLAYRNSIEHPLEQAIYYPTFYLYKRITQPEEVERYKQDREKREELRRQVWSEPQK